MLPDGAGVHNHHICTLGFVYNGIATFYQKTADPLGVSLILLTAVGLHIGLGGDVLLPPKGIDFIAEGKLLLQLFLRNNSCFFHIYGAP